MEIGQQDIDRAEAIARRDEDRRSRRRTAGSRRPPRPRFRAAAARWCRPRRCGRPWRAPHSAPLRSRAEMLPHSACILWPEVSSTLTGRNVPAPTCSVSRCRPTPRSRSAASSAGVKCSPAVGRCDRALIGREHGLVVGAHPLVGRALGGDVGRQRRVPRSAMA